MPLKTCSKSAISRRQKELQLAIKDDPNNLDAHKSLAHIDEALGDQEGAAKEYMAASALDPTDQKLLDQARLYKQLEDMANSSGQALDKIKAGNVTDGVAQLKDIIVTTRIPAAREKAVTALSDAIPIIAKVGDQQLTDKKYPDADHHLRAGHPRRDAALAGAQERHARSRRRPVMQNINVAAKAAGTPDVTFKLFNDVIGVYPDDKVANLELAEVYLAKTPPDYDTAADLEERGGAPDDQVRKLRDHGKKHRK